MPVQLDTPRAAHATPQTPAQAEDSLTHVADSLFARASTTRLGERLQLQAAATEPATLARQILAQPRRPLSPQEARQLIEFADYALLEPLFDPACHVLSSPTSAVERLETFVQAFQRSRGDDAYLRLQQSCAKSLLGHLHETMGSPAMKYCASDGTCRAALVDHLVEALLADSESSVGAELRFVCQHGTAHQVAPLLTEHTLQRAAAIDAPTLRAVAHYVPAPQRAAWLAEGPALFDAATRRDAAVLRTIMSYLGGENGQPVATVLRAKQWHRFFAATATGHGATVAALWDAADEDLKYELLSARAGRALLQLAAAPSAGGLRHVLDTSPADLREAVIAAFGAAALREAVDYKRFAQLAVLQAYGAPTSLAVSLAAKRGMAPVVRRLYSNDTPNHRRQLLVDCVEGLDLETFDFVLQKARSFNERRDRLQTAVECAHRNPRNRKSQAFRDALLKRVRDSHIAIAPFMRFSDYVNAVKNGWTTTVLWILDRPGNAAQVLEPTAVKAAFAAGHTALAWELQRRVLLLCNDPEQAAQARLVLASSFRAGAAAGTLNTEQPFPLSVLGESELRAVLDIAAQNGHASTVDYLLAASDRCAFDGLAVALSGAVSAGQGALLEALRQRVGEDWLAQVSPNALSAAAQGGHAAILAEISHSPAGRRAVLHMFNAAPDRVLQGGGAMLDLAATLSRAAGDEGLYPHLPWSVAVHHAWAAPVVWLLAKEARPHTLIPPTELGEMPPLYDWTAEFTSALMELLRSAPPPWRRAALSVCAGDLIRATLDVDLKDDSFTFAELLSWFEPAEVEELALSDGFAMLCADRPGRMEKMLQPLPDELLQRVLRGPAMAPGLLVSELFTPNNADEAHILLERLPASFWREQLQNAPVELDATHPQVESLLRRIQ